MILLGVAAESTGTDWKIVVLPAFLVLVGTVLVPFVTHYLARRREAKAERVAAVADFVACVRAGAVAAERNWTMPPEAGSYANSGTAVPVDRYTLVRDMLAAEARVASALPRATYDVRSIAITAEYAITGQGRPMDRKVFEDRLMALSTLVAPVRHRAFVRPSERNPPTRVDSSK